jgi:hypothetical protein
VSFSQIGLSITDKISNWPAYRAAAFLQTHTPPQATVLSLKPADMYYAGRRMVSYLDPRLLAFYRTEDPEAAYRRLLDLGIRFVHSPDYSLPPMYNSALQEILARPDLSHLLYSQGGFQIYELKPGMGAICDRPRDLSPKTIPWRRTGQFIVGGRKGLYKFPVSENPLTQRNSAAKLPLPFFHRDFSIKLISDRYFLKAPPPEPKNEASGAMREFRIDLELKGYAYVQVYLKQYDPTGQLISHYLIGETAIGQSSAQQQFARRFFIRPEVESIQIIVEHRGRTRVDVQNATITPVCHR